MTIHEFARQTDWGDYRTITFHFRSMITGESHLITRSGIVFFDISRVMTGFLLLNDGSSHVVFYEDIETIY